MKIKLRQSGFTLIETVFALAIAAMVFGVTMQTNRTILRNSVLTEENTQMNQLVDEALTNLRYLQQSMLTQGKEIGDAATGLNLSLGLTTSVTPQEVIFYTPAVTDHTSPVTVKWCIRNGGGTCVSEISPVAIDGVQPNISEQFSRPALGGEVLAIRHNRSDRRRVVSMSARYTADNSAPCVNAESNSASSVACNTGNSEWDFYIRSISVVRIGTNDTSLFNYGQSLADGTSDDTARGKTYLATITVRKYQRPDVPTISRTLLLTDWK